jgi:hypothetical protein
MRKTKYTRKKTQAPPQTKPNHKLPLNPSHMDGNIKFQTQECSNQDTRFLNAKDHAPPEAKVNHKVSSIEIRHPTRQA